MRIIMAASMDSEALIPIRLIIICREVLIRTDAKIVEIMNTAVPIRSGTSPLSSTNPVSARVIFVISIPRSVTTSERPKKRAKSSVFRESLRYSKRSRMSSFFSGSGA